ncbi:hypothetical protein [Fimbriimonas ginsengisoli]|uniref:hypothetical protein n=1 Tax=Fimbriimonas ginsengisoli TaxID=1005039 RepID=UPI00046D15CA|nr:hypothetical protein [Fimbriimonas ginsengisoli]
MTVAGCGGGGQSSSNNRPGPGADPVPTGTAKFTVDVKTGKVTVTPLGKASAEARAIFSGAAVSFSTGDLTIDSGELTRRVLAVALRNNRNEPINGPFRLLFGPFKTLANPNLDQRLNTTVTTVAGSGSLGYADGFGTSAAIKQPSNSIYDPNSGALYFGTSDGKIRRVKNGTVSTIATGFSKPSAMCFPPSRDGGLNFTTLAVVDSGTNKLSTVDIFTGAVRPVLGTGTNASTDGFTGTASFATPMGIMPVTVYETDSGPMATYLITDSVTGKVRFVSPGINPATNQLELGVSTVATGLNKPMAIGGLSAYWQGHVAIAESGANRINIMVIPNGGPGVSVGTIGTGVAGSADGSGATATFNGVQGMVCVPGSAIYVADTVNNKIRQILLSPDGTIGTPANWTVATLAGSGALGSADGAGNVATFNVPAGISVTPSGHLLVSDTGANKIRDLAYNTGSLPIQVGSGGGTVPPDPVRLANPSGFAPGTIAQPYILAQNFVGPGQQINLEPWSLIVPNGVNYFEFTVTVESITSTEAPPNAVNNPGPAVAPGSPAVLVRTYSGGAAPSFNNGSLAEAGFGAISSSVVDNNGTIWIADTANNAIRRIGDAYRNTGGSTGGGTGGGGDGTIRDLVTTIAGVVGIPGTTDGAGPAAQFNAPTGIACSPDGTVIYVADSGNHTIRRIVHPPLNTVTDPSDPAYYSVTTVAGVAGTAGFADGLGSVAKFNKPYALTMSQFGDLFITESVGNRVRRLSVAGADPFVPSVYTVTTVAGDTSTAAPVAGSADGTGAIARFSDPRGIGIANTGDLYVADRGNHRVRRIAVGGVVTTLAGSVAGYGDSDTGSAAKFTAPTGVSVVPSGYIFVADSGNKLIRRISQAGTVRTVAGTGVAGNLDGTGNSAQFSANLATLLALPSGDLLVPDGPRLRVVERIISTGDSH